jgi:hypothetical protein
LATRIASSHESFARYLRRKERGRERRKERGRERGRERREESVHHLC